MSAKIIYFHVSNCSYKWDIFTERCCVHMHVENMIPTMCPISEHNAVDMYGYNWYILEKKSFYGPLDREGTSSVQCNLNIDLRI